jgi:arsenite methyltransferase
VDDRAVSSDPKDLESTVKAMYRAVAENPDFRSEIGRATAERPGDTSDDQDRIPAAAIESSAGVGDHLGLAVS